MAEEDPFDGAAAQAARMERDHADQLSAVGPVAGLLAEAARTGGVTESDARGLAALSGVDRIRLQLHPRLGLPEGVDPAVVDRALVRVGPYAVDRGREVARGGAVALRSWLDDRSGLGRLEELIRSRFTRRSRPLKAAQALRTIKQLSHTHAFDRGAGARIRDLLEAAHLDPVMHRLNELSALSTLARAGAEGEPLRAELERMIDFDEPWQQLGADRPGSAHELRALARRLAGQSRARIVLARNPLASDAARVLSRSYQLLTQTL